MLWGFLVEYNLEKVRGEDGGSAVMEPPAGVTWGDELGIFPWGRPGHWPWKRTDCVKTPLKYRISHPCLRTSPCLLAVPCVIRSPRGQPRLHFWCKYSLTASLLFKTSWNLEPHVYCEWISGCKTEEPLNIFQHLELIPKVTMQHWQFSSTTNHANWNANSITCTSPLLGLTMHVCLLLCLSVSCTAKQLQHNMA